jgi:enoyl-CoA hydratase
MRNPFLRIKDRRVGLCWKMGEIQVDVQEPIAIVTISRQGKLNSVTWEMLQDFDTKIGELFENPKILGILFTGEGERAFSAGFDREMVESLEGQDHFDFFKLLEKAIKRFQSNRKCITLAACNGFAIGFGAILAVSCDFRFFSENTVFSLPEILLDVFPGAGASSYLLHIVGPSRAKDILMTGRKVDAEEAYEIGLANRILKINQLIPESMKFLKDITSHNQMILEKIKSLLDEITDSDFEKAAEIESDYFLKWLNERKSR